jgi:ABC-type transporter Mla MlaB component
MLAEQLGRQGSDFQDSFGGGVQYDPETGTYIAGLSPQEQALQEASYAEEGKRLTLDQDLRRRQLTDAERMRGQASNEQDQALRDIDAFRGGVGQVDTSKLAAMLAANKAQQVNAGYDDVNRAVNTMSVRSGGDASDTLAGLARNRTRDLASVGDPYLEALNAGEQINTGRLQSRLGAYNIFNTGANRLNDQNFTPSGYNAAMLDRGATAEKLAQGWKDLQGSAASNAAQTYLGGGQLMNQGQTVYNKQYNPYGTAQMWSDFGSIAKGLEDDATSAATGGKFGGTGKNKIKLF